MHPLDAPKLKVARAKEHLDALDEVLRVFFYTKPVSSTTTIDPQNRKRILRIEMALDVPPRISILAADAMYNLRSALDQIAHQLALLGCREPHPRCEFPISCQRPTEKVGLALTKRLSGIPIEAINLINRFQPYSRAHDVESHPLWLLDTLCNHDRHRGLIASSALADVVMPSGGFDGSEQTRINERTIELSFPIQEHNFEPKVTPGIHFLKHRLGDRVSDKTLREIHQFVSEDMLPRFERFFP